MANDRSPHKMRVSMKDKVALVKVLIRHPMETGRRKDKMTGRNIPRYFIRELRCDYNGETVLTADWSGGAPGIHTSLSGFSRPNPAARCAFSG